jgi:hypothetical protein
MVAVYYGTVMDKMKDDTQAACQDIPAQSPLLNGFGKRNWGFVIDSECPIDWQHRI